MWFDEAEEAVQDGEACPHCGFGPLEVFRGEAECPNCGSVFEGE